MGRAPKRQIEKGKTKKKKENKGRLVRVKGRRIPGIKNGMRRGKKDSNPKLQFTAVKIMTVHILPT